MALRISLFYAAIFSVIGVMMPFWPVWLKAQGMTPIQIGLILAAGTWTRAIVNPLLAQTADRQGRPDILIIGLGWGALGLHTLLLFTNGFWLLFVVCVIASTLLFALMPMADAVTMLKVRKGLIDYGRVRLWGSLTFIVTAIGGGYLLKDKTEDLILWLVIGLLIITVGSCHIVPRSDTSGTKRFLEPLTYIFRNRSLLFFILAASLIQASHAVYYGFSTLHWRAQGINEAIIGILWAEGVIAEIILFAVAGKYIEKIGPVKFLALAIVAGLLRWTVLGLTTEIMALIVVQILHAFTFGATHLAALYFIARNIPAEFTSTAQSFYSSFAVGITMSLALLSAGWLYDVFEGKSFFAMIILVSIAGLTFPLITQKEKKFS